MGEGKYNPKVISNLQFKLFIPVDIVEAVEVGTLTITEAWLLAYIHALDRKKGCFASNKHFAERLHTSEKSISRYISRLMEKEFITCESFDGRQRVLRSLYKTISKKGERGKNRLDRTVHTNRQKCPV
ncbi:MAG: hypothetical protein EZS26_001933 [Candidatus Ordinivivax streblomastigis]|uniref:DnaD N-terminal domain-containing protein n=1 Tax=Candidatus Ordinivivax streblomastigis TaxID=2540710 RepID=A0A5M8P0R2_9BACT|nr:MAG: hypothetical protein EZS26_001933 [Candidatus Ordinivivax streblomastigis]